MKTRDFSLVLGAAGFLALAPGAAKWSASLQAVDGSSLAGTASVETTGGAKGMAPKDTMAARSMDNESATAIISITGAKPGSKLAWYVHQAKCGASGPVVGSSSAYQPLTADGKGKATATAKLSAGLTEGQEYSVAVHGGASESAPVAACGDLRPGGISAGPVNQ